MKHLRRLATVAVALALGLVVVEAVFRLRDHGAFPHLNVYVADARLGVRLRPQRTEKISFSNNPVSTVRINASGYRGADWPARTHGREILVVGDSQAFGLGVEEDQTFAARVGVALERPVVDAAVPTYGPPEFRAVLEEELPRRRPGIVIYTVNLANDLFEVARPNSTRHTVWDGWAVRTESMPTSAWRFRGRPLLYRDSHAFFALRSLFYRWQSASDEAGVPSEGGWQDLVQSAEDRARVEKDNEAKLAALRARIVAERRRKDARDIVRRHSAESARPVYDIAEELALAAGATGQHSVLAEELVRVKALTEAHGAQLVVLVLPLDVQVSASEWAKYDVPPRDLSKTRVLVDDVLADAKRVGAVGVDPWSALAAAEPGAFLDGDLHLSPKGHEAVARAIVAALAARGVPGVPSDL